METSMKHRTLLTPLLLLAAALAMTPPLSGQSQGQTEGEQGTTFRTTTNFVRTHVIVRDRQGRFVPDLKVDEFRVYEDGILQNITLFTPWIGGRALGNLATTASAAAAPVEEGLILPSVRPRQDESGRLFIVFIDDLHLQPSDTPRVKDLLKRVRDTLIHDNDLVGFVSTGTSSISIDPSYDYGHRRFNEAIERVMGSAPSPDEFIEAALIESAQGPQQVRFNAHVAFRTAYELLEQLANIQDRRKAFVYISNGYHFNPFAESRLQRIKDFYSILDADLTQEEITRDPNQTQDHLQTSAFHQRTAFSTADLINQVAELTRAAQRANVAFYTIDPRGLQVPSVDAGADLVRRHARLHHHPGEHAPRAGRRDGRVCRRRVERLRRHPAADRFGDERLLRGGVHLVESRSDEAAPLHQDRADAPRTAGADLQVGIHAPASVPQRAVVGQLRRDAGRSRYTRERVRQRRPLP
jgi:VWFA-related protein